MRNLWLLLIITVHCCISSCKKEGFITSPEAIVQLSTDTLHFDTVFTTSGSTTRSFKIFNRNNQSLRISKIELKGGNNSYFQMNIDGYRSNSLTNIDIAPNDSIYGFVTVKINPSNNTVPFIVRDSIGIDFNGNSRLLQLEAYGQNAIFVKNGLITKDTTWTNQLPIVLIGECTIQEKATLTIQKGTKIYCNADAPITVNGNIMAIGEKYDSTRIQFLGNRIDEPYKNYPGSWPGIFLNAKSNNNEFTYCIIKNAYQGIICQQPSSNTLPKLLLNNTIIDNITDIALGGSNTSIVANNCLFTNCGFNIYLISGGTYNFNFCTITSIYNSYVPHKNACVTVSNTNNSNFNNALNCSFNNSIIYGDGNSLLETELISQKQSGTPFLLTLDHVLYKAKTINPDWTITNSLQNQLPGFETIDVSKQLYKFTLKSSSPCIDKGKVMANITTDMNGNNRYVGNAPDLGCYEAQ